MRGRASIVSPALIRQHTMYQHVICALRIPTRLWPGPLQAAFVYLAPLVWYLHQDLLRAPVPAVIKLTVPNVFPAPLVLIKTRLATLYVLFALLIPIQTSSPQRTIVSV